MHSKSQLTGYILGEPVGYPRLSCLISHAAQLAAAVRMRGGEEMDVATCLHRCGTGDRRIDNTFGGFYDGSILCLLLVRLLH